MRSGKKTVQIIFSQTGKAYFTSRGSGFQASRATLSQAAWEEIETIIAQEIVGRAATETTDREKSVQYADADFLQDRGYF